MATTAKKPGERLTLRDATDLMLALNQAIEDHVDEIELNEGVLPEWMQAMLDEIDAALSDRVDALAYKIDEFTGYAASAKATKDRAARREKVWTNAIKGMKAYGLYQVQRHGGAPIKGAAATMRIQANGAPSVVHDYPAELLLNIADQDTAIPLHDEASGARHPLAPYIRVKREASIDTKALAAAYLVRQRELEAEADLVGESDIPGSVLDALGPDDPTRRNAIPDVLADLRSNYVHTHLAAEFPGVRVERGVHLRID